MGLGSGHEPQKEKIRSDFSASLEWEPWLRGENKKIDERVRNVDALFASSCWSKAVFRGGIASGSYSRFPPLRTGREARTPDTWFWRPVLYRLSYSRICECKGRILFEKDNSNSRFFYFNFSQSSGLKPTRTVSSVMISGRFTSFPLEASRAICSLSLMPGNRSLRCISL